MKFEITSGAKRAMFIFGLLAVLPFQVSASTAYDLIFNQAFVLRPVTIAMAIAGAVISYGYPDDASEKLSRSRVVWGVIWSSFIALVLTSLAIDFMGWQWAEHRQGPLAGFMAAALRTVWPMIKSAIPDFLRNWGGRGASSPRKNAEQTNEEANDNANQ